MKRLKFEDKETWLSARLGKITGSRLKDVVTLKGTGKKIGYYELIAERLAIPPDDQSAMERGIELEVEAIAQFVKETGKEVNTDLVIWQRDDNESISVSPDGYIGEIEAVECKCLSSARHIEAFLTNAVPKDYEFQVLQYFIVNEKLETLYLCFYDPRLAFKSFFYLTITRESVKDDVVTYLEYQRKMLEEVSEIVNKLSF